MALDGFGVRASEQEAWDWADHFVLVNRTGAQTLHLLDPESTPEDPFPLCKEIAGYGASEFQCKESSIFPPGYKPICKNCRERLKSIL